MVAGLIITYKPMIVAGALAFGIVLGLFIQYLYKSLDKKNIKEATVGAKDLGVLIAMVALSLLIPGLIVTLKPTIIIGTIFFGLVLLGFMWLLYKALDKKDIKDATVGARDLGILIGMVALSLLVPGLIVTLKPKILVGTFFFGIILVGFIWLLAKALDKKELTKATVGAKDLGILVGMVALSLLVPGLIITLKPDIIRGTVLFGLILWGFIKLLTKAVFGKSNQKEIARSIVGAKELGVLVALAAGSLLTGGLFLIIWPKLIITVPLFGVLLWGFVALICNVAKTLALHRNILDQSQKAMFKVIIIVGLAFGAFLLINIIANLYRNDPVYALACIGGFIAALYLLGAGLSGLFIFVATLTGGAISAALMLAISALSLGTFAFIKIGMSMFGGTIEGAKKEIISYGVIISLLAEKLASIGNPITLLRLMLAVPVALLMSSIALILTQPLLVIADIMTKLDSLKSGKVNFSIITDNIDGLAKVVKAISDNEALTSYDVIWKMMIVKKSMVHLGEMIVILAEAIQAYAELKVPTGWDNKGKVLGYRKLANSDFNQAAKNVAKIITVLGGAVMDVYEANPTMFNWNLFVDNAFVRTIKSNERLAGLVTKIACAVKNYASLMVPFADPDTGEIKVDKDGKPTRFMKLEQSHFKEAAKNVKSILEVLGEAIIDVYNSNPDMYDQPGLFESIFAANSNSPFVNTIKQNMKLADLVSKIGSAVASYSRLMVPFADPETGEVQVDKEGKPKRYRVLKESDFTAAANNISLIIDTLGGAIMDTYNKHKDWYDEDNWWLRLIGFGTGNPFVRTIKQNMKLADLISKIGSAVASYSRLMVPFADPDTGEVKVDKDGKPKRYKVLTTSDFVKASTNIALIIETLGSSIMKIYKDHEKDNWYADDLWTNIWKGGSPFSRVVSQNMKLADLVSKIGSSIAAYATLMVPFAGNDGKIAVDKNGKPTQYRQLKSTDFTNAATNISTIITTLGNAIMATYDEHPDWFDEGWFSDSPFQQCMETYGKLSEMITNIVQGIQSYADLKFPHYEYDERTGQMVIKSYEEITDTTFEEAADNIGKVISKLGNTIIDEASKHPDWFDDGEDSAFVQASIAFSNMGNMVSGIATGLQAYADMKFPVYKGVDKNGQPIVTDYKPINETTFKDAANHIGIVITELARIIEIQVTTHPEWFDDGEDSPFNIAMTAVNNMGGGIAAIAEAIKTYSDARIPKSYNPDGSVKEYVDLSDPNVFQKMGDNIGKIITSMGNAILNLYDGKDAKGNKRENGTAFSELIKKGPNQQDTPLGIMIEAISTMGEAIGTVAEGVVAYASGTFTDAQGKTQQLGDTEYTNAADNISNVITVIGTTLLNLYNGKTQDGKKLTDKQGNEVGDGFKQLIQDSGNGKETILDKMVKASKSIGKVITTIAEAVSGYASGQFIDENGKTITLPPEKYGEAADNVSNLITAIGSAIVGVWNSAKGKEIFDDEVQGQINFGLFKLGGGKTLPGTSPFVRIANAVNTMTVLLTGLANNLNTYANGLYWDSNTKQWFKVNFESAKTNINKIIVGVATAIKDAYIRNKDFFDDDSMITIVTNVMVTLGKSLSFIATSLNKIMTALPIIKKSIDGINKEGIGNMSGAITAIVNMFNTEISAVSYVLQSTSAVLRANMVGLQIATISSTIEKLNGIFAQIELNIKPFNTHINNITGYTAIFKTAGENINNLLGIFDDIKIQDSNELFNIINNVVQNLTIISNNIQSMLDNFVIINKILPDLSKNINKLVFDDNLKSLGSKIDELVTIFSLPSSSTMDFLLRVQIFKNEVTEVKKFVTSINTFNTIKAKSVQSLVESLYKLAGKMDMAKLAEVLDKKLNGTLIQLTKRIQEAEKTILKAEEIQKNRHKAIEKSISKVSELMNTKLFVEVSQKQEPSPTTPSDTPAEEGNVHSGGGDHTQQGTTAGPSR